ncbi:MAG TPA: SPFH domain-containing protein [Candidatus Goldiibacteriota bacterium]|nr:SPFH domain-containing protein [Candidatus Goldiibacteriota bacterium]HPN64513.1 SPFH domain-containing protein [Candidatus Goldiibacteriota bacterium]HRQ43416.1 SPFH domain-containing protein [Candidatus Goldiibacteriota bacterium]
MTISFLIAAAVVLIVLLPTFIKIAQEYERLVIFRLGRCIGEKGPGLVLLIPFVDRPVRVDLRELYLEIPSQTCITKDNAGISIDFLIYWKVIDAVKTVVQVGNFAGASQGIATTTLRAIVGDISLDDVLAKREEINMRLRTKLDEVTERWGVKITSVEIRELTPPKEIQESMTKQMSAERTRRALVTEAEGQKVASITVAEGQKQSAILKAEGEQQSQILRADGYAKALNEIFSAAKGVDSNTMLLQYFEALKDLGAKDSTKFVIPMELTSLVSAMAAKAKETIK